MASRAAFRDRDIVEGLEVLGVSSMSESMKRPPPPGPPGTYRRLFGGGSLAAAAASAAARAARAALVVPGGRPRRLAVGGLLGVGEAGAILKEAKDDEYGRFEGSLAQESGG